MGKNKLKKFSEMEQIPFVFQYPWGRLQNESFPHKGAWRNFFGNDNPITLELGCGKGEYTVGLAGLYPDRNFIGIDIKGARMWTGAKMALQRGMGNVAFLRTDIDLLASFFAPGEVDELWITFPDPQMQKPRKRLTGSKMLGLYRELLSPQGRVHLKTDSPFLYRYTTMLCHHNSLPVHASVEDVYAASEAMTQLPSGTRELQTHYENQWLQRGLTIKCISFSLPPEAELSEPPGAEDIEKDTYRSYSRGYIQMPQLLNNE